MRDRARNEHGNGLLREYFPRHRDFSTITAEELQRVEDALNDRPRKRLKFLTPNEVFFNYDRLALQGRIRPASPDPLGLSIVVRCRQIGRARTNFAVYRAAAICGHART